MSPSNVFSLPPRGLNFHFHHSSFVFKSQYKMTYENLNSQGPSLIRMRLDISCDISSGKLHRNIPKIVSA